ncbi:hypothetical protein K469DRAFT_710345, partial [Zopfia rhizophila CBS 207.26]
MNPLIPSSALLLASPITAHFQVWRGNAYKNASTVNRVDCLDANRQLTVNDCAIYTAEKDISHNLHTYVGCYLVENFGARNWAYICDSGRATTDAGMAYYAMSSDVLLM